MGYGGLRLALDLEKGIRKRHLEWELLLLDQHPFHQLVTELHQVAAGSIMYDFATIPYERLLRNRRVTFRQARVVGFDFPGKTVLTESGPVHYDTLVIALGGEVDYLESAHYHIAGLREHALIVQPIQQAHRTYAQLQERLFRFIKQRSEGHIFGIVMGGGGSTGVELAGQLADEIEAVRKSQRLPKESVSIHLVEASARLVSGFHPKISNYVTRILQRKGIVIHLSDPIVKISDRDLLLASGKLLPYHVLIWAGGVRGHHLMAGSGLKTDAKDRIVVNGYLQAQGAEGVYAVGDCAGFIHPETGIPSPPMARLAIEQARWLARYLLKESAFPFLPAFRGAVISLGKGSAVAVAGNLRFFGRVASFLKAFITIRYLFSIGKVRLAVHQFRVGILGKI
jgi:NADH dehydrogenase